MGYRSAIFPIQHFPRRGCFYWRWFILIASDFMLRGIRRKIGWGGSVSRWVAEYSCRSVKEAWWKVTFEVERQNSFGGLIDLFYASRSSTLRSYPSYCCCFVFIDCVRQFTFISHKSWARGKQVNENKLRYEDGGLELSGERFKLKINLDFLRIFKKLISSRFAWVLVVSCLLRVGNVVIKSELNQTPQLNFRDCLVKVSSLKLSFGENFLWVVIFDSCFCIGLPLSRNASYIPISHSLIFTCDVFEMWCLEPLLNCIRAALLPHFPHAKKYFYAKTLNCSMC